MVSDCAGQLNFEESFGKFFLFNTQQFIETAHLGILKRREFILKGPIIKNRLFPGAGIQESRSANCNFLGQIYRASQFPGGLIKTDGWALL